jgi:hypothetical protein
MPAIASCSAVGSLTGIGAGGVGGAISISCENVVVATSIKEESMADSAELAQGNAA